MNSFKGLRGLGNWAEASRNLRIACSARRLFALLIAYRLVLDSLTQAATSSLLGTRRSCCRCGFSPSFARLSNNKSNKLIEYANSNDAYA